MRAFWRSTSAYSNMSAEGCAASMVCQFQDRARFTSSGVKVLVPRISSRWMSPCPPTRILASSSAREGGAGRRCHARINSQNTRAIAWSSVSADGLKGFPGSTPRVSRGKGQYIRWLSDHKSRRVFGAWQAFVEPVVSGILVTRRFAAIGRKTDAAKLEVGNKVRLPERFPILRYKLEL